LVAFVIVSKNGHDDSPIHIGGREFSARKIHCDASRVRPPSCAILARNYFPPWILIQEAKPMGTSQGPQTTQTAAAEPRSGTTITPTPRPQEIAGFLTAMANKTLPFGWKLAMDGSPIDPHSFDPTPVTTPTWP
jgi:hypothetical protein